MFGFFKRNKESSSIAKDRLSVAIMSDRQSTKSNAAMEAMKAEIIEVIKKYMGVRNIEISKEVVGEVEALSIDVQLETELQ